MATKGGPNTEKDGLVFGYDTGYGVADKNTATRFYPGRPTSNIVPDAYTMSGWGNYSSGNDGTFITEYGTTGYKVRNKNTWNGISKGITLPSTGTYTISAWFRIWGKSSGNNGINVYTNGGGIGDTAQGGDDTKIGEWQRIAMTRTYTTTSITFFIISWGGTSGTDWSSWDVTMPQIEKQSTQSPFLTGTRSSTQSLIDLKRTTDIDVSNVSFDSTGQPTFDGSNDYINIPSSFRSYFTSAPVAVELVLKKSSADQAAMVVFDVDITRWNLNYNLYTANQWAFDFYDGTEHVISAGNYDNEYVHFVLQQLSNGTMEIYANGILKGTITSSGNLAPNSSGPRIGSRSNGDSRYFKGELPVFKIFSKSLTVDEIKQNFNAYKNRFNI